MAEPLACAPLSGLAAIHRDAEARAELLRDVVRARSAFILQKEANADALSLRQRAVDRSEAAARAAGLELPE